MWISLYIYIFIYSCGDWKIWKVRLLGICVYSHLGQDDWTHAFTWCNINATQFHFVATYIYIYRERDMDSGKPFTAPFVPHSWGQEVLALQVGAGTAYVVQVQRHGLSFVMFVTKPLSHAKPSSMVWKRHEKASRLGSMNCLGNLRPPLSSFCFRKYNWAFL